MRTTGTMTTEMMTRGKEVWTMGSQGKREEKGREEIKQETEKKVVGGNFLK